MEKELSKKQIHRIERIDEVVRDYFEAHPAITEIPAKTLMPVFIEKGIFYKYERNGLPVCNLLHNLVKRDKLALLKHTSVIRHAENRNWYFLKSGI